MIGSVLTYISTVLESLWTGFLGVISVFLQFLADLVMFVLSGIVELTSMLIAFAVSLLPAVPTLPTPTGGLPDFLLVGNYFVPLDVALGTLPVWGAVYGGIWLYKSGKFMRGGG